MTVIRGGTDDEIRAQVAEAGGTERDADVVQLGRVQPPSRPNRANRCPGDAVRRDRPKYSGTRVWFSKTSR